MRESGTDVKRRTRREQVKLQGKVALVTGASRGIGRAIAIGLAAEGAHVAINYVSRPDAAVAVQDAIGALGREGFPVQADVAVAAEVEHMVAQVLGRFGQIDVLVNNATLHRGRRVHRLPESDWDAVIDSCLKGAYHCCQHVVPHMIERRGGRIINISSVVGLVGWPGDTAYAAAKAGLIGLTRSLAPSMSWTVGCRCDPVLACHAWSPIWSSAMLGGVACIPWCL
jgi:3-oxoacyl-[acyl-carrier protein] reductase